MACGGGARAGDSPPRMESNAPEALLCKDSGKRSEDFCAAVRRKSNGIFQAVKKAGGLFDSLGPQLLKSCGPIAIDERIR